MKVIREKWRDLEDSYIIVLDGKGYEYEYAEEPIAELDQDQCGLMLQRVKYDDDYSEVELTVDIVAKFLKAAENNGPAMYFTLKKLFKPYLTE
jgi:hypothetical protein